MGSDEGEEWGRGTRSACKRRVKRWRVVSFRKRRGRRGETRDTDVV